MACCRCLVTKSCPTLCDPMDCSPPGFFCPRDFPGNNTGVGCHFLLQGMFPPRDWISCIAGGSLSTESHQVKCCVKCYSSLQAHNVLTPRHSVPHLITLIRTPEAWIWGPSLPFPIKVSLSLSFPICSIRGKNHHIRGGGKDMMCSAKNWR